MRGNITASSSSHGSGIGTGVGSYGSSMIGNLTIVSGNITASSSSGGSGIGTAYGTGSGFSMIKTLSVLGGRIKVNGIELGIGSGFDRSEVQLSEILRNCDFALHGEEHNEVSNQCFIDSSV
jgi:hypothetical protein